MQSWTMTAASMSRFKRYPNQRSFGLQSRRIGIQSSDMRSTLRPAEHLALDPDRNSWQAMPVPANMTGRSSYLTSWTGCQLLLLGGEVVEEVANPCDHAPQPGCDPPPPP